MLVETVKKDSSEQERITKTFQVPNFRKLKLKKNL